MRAIRILLFFAHALIRDNYARHARGAEYRPYLRGARTKAFTSAPAK